MLNNYKKIISTFGCNPVVNKTLVDYCGHTSYLKDSARYYYPEVLQAFQYSVLLQNIKSDLYTDWYTVRDAMLYLILGTNSKTVTPEDYTISSIKSSYSNISSFFTGQTFTASSTYNSDDSRTVNIKLAFIGQSSWKCSELGLVTTIGNFASSTDSGDYTALLLDRVVFPTIQVEKGKSVVINYSFTHKINLSIPETS